MHEVRVFSTLNADQQSNELLKEIRHTLGIQTITQIHQVKIYRLEGLNDTAVEQLTKSALIEELGQQYTINKPLITVAPISIEIGYKPGVMNPEVGSLVKVAGDLGIPQLIAADTSMEYHFFGNPTAEQVNLITGRLLLNQTVQRIIVHKPTTLRTPQARGAVATIPIRDMNDHELVELSKKGSLFLLVNEMRAIQQYFFHYAQRDPFDVELETIAQTWSEHCYHKTFKAQLIVDGREKKPLFTRLKETAYSYFNDTIVSAFVDNAGAFKFYDGYAVLGKVETHNSPSAIEPYGGAATGSGGVFRDVMGTGQGAKVIASTDMFCFAPPTMAHDQLPPGCLHPSYLLRKVVAGVRDYGNRMGIPTNNGSVHFHPDFRAKPTVIVGAYGIAPEQYCKKGAAQIGDLIFVIGGKTGRDGIHGATFSSGEMTVHTMEVNASAVQIGNPIEQKRMADALLVCRDAGLIRALTDCGAGGLSSAIGEMGAECGVQVELDRVPLKYTGLSGWEIWVSESQERMVCAIAPEHGPLFIEQCAEYGVQATEIGYFSGSKKLQVLYEQQVVCDLSMEFLHHDIPPRVMKAQKKKKEEKLSALSIPAPAHEQWQSLYCSVMAHWNVCSKESIARYYDHEVQGMSALPSFAGVTHSGPNDAAVMTPLLGKPYGFIISHGMNPILNRIDPYLGSWWAIAEALSNMVAVGGNYRDAALIDNFIWPFPDEESLWDLDRAVDACVDAMNTFKIPFISGKDSLSSTYRFADGSVLKVPPVLCISAMGKISDVTKTVSADFKREGSLIILLGSLDVNNMGGSVYLDILNSPSLMHGGVPRVSPELPSLFEKLYKAIQQGKVLACHDISEGGIAVTLAEMCFGNNRGARINLDALGIDRPDFLLFNETAGCFLIEIAAEQFDTGLFFDIPHVVVGRTMRESVITIQHNSNTLCQLSINELRSAWQRPIGEIFS